MGTLGMGEVVTPLVAVAALAVCVLVAAESVRRFRGHRFDHPPALLGRDERERVSGLRRDFLRRRYALVRAADVRVRECAFPGPGTAGPAPADPVRVVADLDRDLARLDAEERRAIGRARAEFADRRERAERGRAAARWWDLACAGAAALVAGGSVAAGVAALL